MKSFAVRYEIIKSTTVLVEVEARNAQAAINKAAVVVKRLDKHPDGKDPKGTWYGGDPDTRVAYRGCEEC